MQSLTFSYLTDLYSLLALQYLFEPSGNIFLSTLTTILLCYVVAV